MRSTSISGSSGRRTRTRWGVPPRQRPVPIPAPHGRWQRPCTGHGQRPGGRGRGRIGQGHGRWLLPPPPPSPGPPHQAVGFEDRRCRQTPRSGHGDSSRKRWVGVGCKRHVFPGPASSRVSMGRPGDCRRCWSTGDGGFLETHPARQVRPRSDQGAAVTCSAGVCPARGSGRGRAGHMAAHGHQDRVGPPGPARR